MKTALKFFVTFAILTYSFNLALHFYETYKKRSTLLEDIKFVVSELENRVPLEVQGGVLFDISFDGEAVHYHTELNKSLIDANSYLKLKKFVMFQDSFKKCTSENIFLRDTIEGGFAIKMSFYDNETKPMFNQTTNKEICQKIRSKSTSDLMKFYLDELDGLYPFVESSGVEIFDQRFLNNILFRDLRLKNIKIKDLNEHQLTELQQKYLELKPQYLMFVCDSDVEIFLKNSIKIIVSFKDAAGELLYTFTTAQENCLPT